MIAIQTHTPETLIDYRQILVNSSAFSPNGMIPSKYTCDGINVSPPLVLQGVPPRAKSLAIIVDDADAPNGTWVHWIIWNIRVVNHIEEAFNNGIQGLNDYKGHSYSGPCPPSSMHRYYFKVYALDSMLAIKDSSNIIQLEKAMCNHILGFGILAGRYVRKQSFYEQGFKYQRSYSSIIQEK